MNSSSNSSSTPCLFWGEKEERREWWKWFMEGVCVSLWLVACNTNHKKNARCLCLVMVCECGSVIDYSLTLTSLVEWLESAFFRNEGERERESETVILWRLAGLVLIGSWHKPLSKKQNYNIDNNSYSFVSELKEDNSFSLVCQDKWNY